MEINERWVAYDEVVDDQNAVFIDYEKDNIIQKLQEIDNFTPI